MSLIGLPLFVLLIAICVLLNAALIHFWNRFRGRRWVKNFQRFGILAFAQLLVVTTTFVGINHSMVFYATWRDLFGNYAAYNNPITQIQIETSSPLDTYIRSTRAGVGFHSNGGVFSFVLTGTKSGVTAPVYVYLPPTYGSDPNKKWPVLVLLPGYPGVPTTWFHALDLIHIIRHEVSTGFAHDFVLVLPTLSVTPPRDTECTDIPGGPQVNTWLGVDVPNSMISGLSVSQDRNDWAITGYSTGGFCAAKVMLSHSDRFSVAIPIAAYFTPFKGKLTGNLFGGSQTVMDANSPLLLAKALKLPSHMLLVGSSQDPGVMGDITAMEKVRNPNLVMDQLVDQHGGHTTKVWKSQLPRILDWLSTKIPHI
ncbi:MAG TPA: alpha/beta hydrolase-fold protein [Candidatus Nanopelagicaceae bacterium]